MQNRVTVYGKDAAGQFTESNKPGRYSSRPRSVYFHLEDFMDDLRAGVMKENYVLEESVFMELASRMALDFAFAKEIADKAVIALMSANDGDEINGLVVLAQQFVDEGG